MPAENWTPQFWVRAHVKLAEQEDKELEAARRMDEEHPDPGMSVGYEEALLMCRIEAEQCTCRWDEESGTPIQDGCLWHSESAREEEEQAQLAAEEARARGEGSEG